VFEATVIRSVGAADPTREADFPAGFDNLISFGI
jgi:hypothetical protein